MAECYLYGQNAVAAGGVELVSDTAKYFHPSSFPYSETFSESSPIRYISFGTGSGSQRIDCFIDIVAKRYFIPVYNSSEGSSSYKYFSLATDIENIYEFSISADATFNFTFSSDFKQMIINIPIPSRASVYFSYFV